ncbi:MAG: AAA family ATPase [Rhodanobacteraceae bacterium]|jgi:predicted kinase|nr:AAA family ATPase [Rhodanobacteraceae bacterium]MBP6079092.1 AAA family ATPase [Xanthomonadales bacterium]MBP7622824.1 AAA family ATPase [Xanthomonadales bacterium]
MTATYLPPAPRARHPHWSRPIVVALMGLPGAGKSTLANTLSERLDLRIANRDVIARALFPHCSYSLPEKRAAFHAVLLSVEVNGALGESTVIDGMTFSSRADLDRVARIAAKYDLILIPIWLDLPPEVAKARIGADRRSGRYHPADDRTPALVDAVLERFERPQPTVPVIDAMLPANTVLDVAEQIIAQRALRAR